ncbi:uroporphyrinogen decarboxylase [Rhodomicrobium sp.]|uniref:uroporphyrinogen decarboxylase n=1 Tax=Rhodomicrobium sp. TaxID=2720632 RepID=UPI0039E5A18B
MNIAADTPKTDPKFIAALKGTAHKAPPMWLMRQAGRYLAEYREVRAQAGSFLNLCYNPELAAEVTLQPIRRFDFDAAIIFSDILVVPHALGQHLEFREGEGPHLDPITSLADLSKLSVEKAKSTFSIVYEAIDRTITGLGDRTPLIGFCGAPWTVASYMVEGHGSSDYRAAKLLAYREPETFKAILDLLVDASATYLIGQVNAGARALQIFDSWASALADNDFDAFVIEPTAEIVKRVKAVHPNVPVIGFPRGASPKYADYVARTGVDALGCDTAAPLPTIAAQQDKVTVQGNLDPLLLLAGGDAMDHRVNATLEALAGKPYVFNLGHGILPDTPVEHVERLIRQVRG